MVLYDCVVVGSGPGGTSALISLCRSATETRKIALVECGKFGREVFENRTRIVGHNFGLPVTYDFALGGTSNLWHGVSAPFELDDIDGWPIRYEDVYEYSKQALELVANERAFPYLFKRKSPASVLFGSDYLNEFDLKTFVYNQKVPRMRQTLESELCNYELYMGYFVDSIEIESDVKDGEIYHLQCLTPNGVQIITSRSVVLAAGALVTPQILLKSKLSTGAKLRDRLPALGHYLSDHPMGSFGQVEFSEPFYSPLLTDLLASDVRFRVGLTCKREMGFLNHNLYIRPSVKRQQRESHINRLRKLISYNSLFKLAYLVAIEAVKDPTVIKSIYLNKFSLLPPKISNADFFCVLEQTPTRSSFVGLCDSSDTSEFMINWVIHEKDFEEYYRYFEHVTDAFARDGRGKITKFYDSYDSIKFLTSAAHHAGTCRLGVSPEDSCVNANLIVHGTRRLFVADASVFPRIGNANVTLSIASIGYRCGVAVAKAL